jgi:hypothetical protein
VDEVGSPGLRGVEHVGAVGLIEDAVQQLGARVAPDDLRGLEYLDGHARIVELPGDGGTAPPGADDRHPLRPHALDSSRGHPDGRESSMIEPGDRAEEPLVVPVQQRV